MTEEASGEKKQRPSRSRRRQRETKEGEQTKNEQKPKNKKTRKEVGGAMVCGEESRSPPNRNASVFEITPSLRYFLGVRRSGNHSKTEKNGRMLTKYA